MLCRLLNSPDIYIFICLPNWHAHPKIIPSPSISIAWGEMDSCRVKFIVTFDLWHRSECLFTNVTCLSEDNSFSQHIHYLRCSLLWHLAFDTGQNAYLPMGPEENIWKINLWQSGIIPIGYLTMWHSLEEYFFSQHILHLRWIGQLRGQVYRDIWPLTQGRMPIYQFDLKRIPERLTFELCE